MNKIELVKRGIKKLLDRSTPIQLFDFDIDRPADEQAVENALKIWHENIERNEIREPFIFTFRDGYSFDNQGITFWLYINGQTELLPDEDNNATEGETEIKVIEISVTEKDGRTLPASEVESQIITKDRMDDELKKLAKRYAEGRPFLMIRTHTSGIYKTGTSHESQTLEKMQQGGQTDRNEFAEFIQETESEMKDFLKQGKSNEFMVSWLEEKLNTAHLFGFNEGESFKK